MKRIYFVRHGETEGNIGKFFQTAETKLTDAGHRGAEAVAARFTDVLVDELWASHYVRAQQTAGYIAKVLKINVQIDDAAHEVVRPSSIHGLEHQSPEGKEHRSSYPENFVKNDWNLDGAENYFTFIKRMKLFVDRLENTTANNIVVVSHGDFIRHLTTFFLLSKDVDVTAHMKVYTNLERMSNVGISECVYRDGGWRLLHWNDHAHFAE